MESFADRVAKLIARRNEARSAVQNINAELDALGVVLHDTQSGTTWEHAGAATFLRKDQRTLSEMSGLELEMLRAAIPVGPETEALRAEIQAELQKQLAADLEDLRDYARIRLVELGVIPPAH